MYTPYKPTTEDLAVLAEYVAYVKNAGGSLVEQHGQGCWDEWSEDGIAGIDAIVAKLSPGTYITLDKGHPHDAEPGVDYAGCAYVADDWRCGGGCCD